MIAKTTVNKYMATSTTDFFQSSQIPTYAGENYYLHRYPCLRGVCHFGKVCRFVLPNVAVLWSSPHTDALWCNSGDR